MRKLGELEKVMREHNELYGEFAKDIFTEQDCRFAQFIDWLNEQPESTQAAVVIAMRFSDAWTAKFLPKAYGGNLENPVIERVEQACEKIGLDLLRPI